MMQMFASGVVTLLFARLLLNDMPHAIGLTQEKTTPPVTPLKYTTYHMHCKRCGYDYSVVLPTPYEWETCPICGYGAPFEEFVLGKAVYKKD